MQNEFDNITKYIPNVLIAKNKSLSGDLPDVDYAIAEADTTFGKIGVKVWIYKGEILNKKAKGGN